MSLYGLEEKLEAPERAPDEIVEIANRMRKLHHGARLKGAEIRYVIEPGRVPPEGGSVSLGKAKRVPKLLRIVLDVDFVIVLNWRAWQVLTEAQREALLDHELTHCSPKCDENGKTIGWEILHHDIEDFLEIIERHGCWTDDLKTARGLIQKTLFHKAAQKVEGDDGRCSACGKTVDMTVSFEAAGRKTKPLCQKCFRKAGRTMARRQKVAATA